MNFSGAPSQPHFPRWPRHVAMAHVTHGQLTHIWYRGSLGHNWYVISTYEHMSDTWLALVSQISSSALKIHDQAQRCLSNTASVDRTQECWKPVVVVLCCTFMWRHLWPNEQHIEEENKTQIGGTHRLVSAWVTFQEAEVYCGGSIW